jgi:hypothetical protein
MGFLDRDWLAGEHHFLGPALASSKPHSEDARPHKKNRQQQQATPQLGP